MFIKLGHINCLTSHPEVYNLLKKLTERNPINILSREDQDFTSQDANRHQRLSYWNHIFLFWLEFSVINQSFEVSIFVKQM